MKQSLPPRPSLAQLKKQAKDLLRKIRNGDSAAVAGWREHHPLGARSLPEEVSAAAVQLQDAQAVVARSYGFSSWAELKRAVEATCRRHAATAGDLAPAVRDFILLASSDRWSDGPGDDRMVDAVAILNELPEIASDPLVAAILGEADPVRRQLEEDTGWADRAVGPHDGWKPLLYVAFSLFNRDPARKAGILDVACRLLDAGADPDAHYLWDPKKPWSRVPALYAASGGYDHAELTELLLERGASPNDNESLFHAAQRNHRAAMEVLRQHGCDPNYRADEQYGNTALHFVLGAWEEHSREGIEWLLEHGADPNVVSTANRETALHQAVQWGRSIEVIDRLITAGARLDATTRDGKTAYALARRTGKHELAEQLESLGAPGPVTAGDEISGLVFSGDEEAVLKRLEANPDELEQVVRSDAGIFVEAAARGMSRVVERLLEAEVALDARGTFGGTALHFACWNGRPELVSRLLDAEADVESRDTSFNGTPLSWTADGSRRSHGAAGHPDDFVECARRLLGAGARLTSWNPGYGETILTVARPEMAKFLRERMAEALCAAAVAGDGETIDAILNQDDSLVHSHGSVHPDHVAFMAGEGADHGWTPLHLAAHYGHPSCVRRLLEREADVDAVGANALANTPLHAAIAGRNVECVAAVLAAGPDLAIRDAAGLTPRKLAEIDSSAEIRGMLGRNEGEP